MSNPENNNPERSIPERPSRSRVSRVESRAKRNLRRNLAIGAVGLLGLALVADKIGLIDLGDLNPTPGQAVGRTKMTDADIIKFKSTGTDALSEAEIDVGDLEQQWIDKPEKGEKTTTVHETMHLVNGRYKGQWVVSGNWQPAVADNGDVTVTLPGVVGKDIVTLDDPVVDASRTKRAFWQSTAGLFGADDTDDAVPRANARKMLTRWVADPAKSGDFQRATACVAIASAAGKVGGLSLSTKVNIDTFVPARAESPKTDSTLPTIRFQIADPQHKDKFLTIKDCLPDLDGMGYDPTKAKTSDSSAFGLAAHRITSLELPPQKQ